MLCKCYHADKNFLGEIGVCWGTKECEACSCGGDESRCDFYDHVRERAKSLSQKPKTTNADRVRALSDEELAKAFARQCAGRVCVSGVLCEECWLNWLRQEVEE